jgi:hypothetical protein
MTNWRECGWGGWIRTNACKDQNLVPYHLATPQQTFKRQPQMRLTFVFIYAAIVYTVFAKIATVEAHLTRDLIDTAGNEPRAVVWQLAQCRLRRPTLVEFGENTRAGSCHPSARKLR